MTCAVCKTKAPTVGVLCQQCQTALLGPIVLSPEQVCSDVVDPTRAAIVDHWGRTHRLAPVTQLGRASITEGPKTPLLLILAPTISRRHAQISLTDGVWRIIDLESANGTFVDEHRVIEEPLPDRSRIRLGRIAFYFIADATGLQAPAVTRAISKTTPPQWDSESASTQWDSESASTLELAVRPQTDRVVLFEFQQPTGGGGAVMTVGGKSLQLTIAQHELMMLLIERMQTERDVPQESRGFVPMDELLVRLSLDSSEAGNVRQLVRRLRRSLVKAGMDDVIESRHSRGYRLLVAPRVRLPSAH